MNNPNGRDPDARDRRPLALLLLALCLLALAAVRQGGFFASLRPVQAPPPIVWGNGPAGLALYRGASASLSDPASQTGLPAGLAPLFFQPIPLNQADEELLTTIPGIGPAFARRLIEFRDQQGRISAIAELDAVKGVGPAKLKILQEHLVTD